MQIVESSIKIKLDYLNHNEKMLNELMEFIFHNTLSLKEMDINTEIAQVYQREREKIE